MRKEVSYGQALASKLKHCSSENYVLKNKVGR